MKKPIFIIFLLTVSALLTAQNVGKLVDTKYLRPSLTVLFFQPKNAQEETIINKMKGLGVVNKFDDNTIDYPYFNGNGLTITERPNKMKSYISNASKLILAKWWNRDANGDFNTEIVAKRGGFAANDADVVQANASNTNRLEMIGSELIDKSYVFLYEINQVLTMEQVYDKTDATNKKYSNYVPVKRENEGYEVTYSVYAYKLNFNDSVASIFYTKYWSDAKNHDAKKVASWSNASFPMIYVKNWSGTLKSTQPKDPKSSIYLVKKKKTMNELLLDIVPSMQTNSVEELGMKIEDLKAKVSVYKTKPLSAKIGTKESLYRDQRFFVYEIEVDKSGNQNKVRKGVARVKQIADNNKVATGETSPSLFQQQGGKKLYEGMLMESNEDQGVAVGIGFASSPQNMQLGGLNLNLDYRISRPSKINGLAVGLDCSLNFMSNLSAGNVSTGTMGLNSTGMSGMTYALDLYIAKEMYFTQKGIVYLRPSIGGGLSGYRFSKYNGVDIPKVTDANGNVVENKNYNWSSIFFPINIGIGFNLSPLISIEIKPGVAFRFASSTGNNESLIQHATLYDPNWGFDSLDKISMSNSILCNLRFRF